MNKRFVAAAAVVVVVMAALGAFAASGLLQPAAASRVVDATTLVLIRGEVQLQRQGAGFAPVTTETTVHPGDRSRTGPDAFAAITYFDGSSTTLEANTEIVLRRIQELPGRGANISFGQEAGQTWNRVELLVGANSRFETTSTAAVAFVRGTQYRVVVDASQVTTIEVAEGAVQVEAAGVTVTVEAGFMTRIVPGQPPSTPVRIAQTGSSVQIDVVGPVRIFLVDDLGRSAGSDPLTGGIASQIPGVLQTSGDGRLRITIPRPTREYELIVSPLGRGAFTIEVADVLDGQVLPAAAPATDIELRLFALINGTRAEAGLPPFAWDPELTEVARAHSRDMVDRGYFSHVTPEGWDPVDRMLDWGVSGFRRGMPWGENVSNDRTIERAYSQDLAEDIVPGGHHGNVVDPGFTRIGIGIVERPGNLIITVLFLP